MSNVLIIPVDFYPNSTGFANASLNLVEAVKKYNPEINIYVYADVLIKEGQQEIEGVKVYRNTRYRVNAFYSRYKELCDIIDNNNIDFVLFETNTFYILQNLLANRYPNKVAVRIHSTADTETMVFRKPSLKGRFLRYTAKKFMKQCNTVLCTNSYHQKFIYKYFYDDNVYTMWDRSHFILPNTVPPVLPVDENREEPYIFALGKLSYDGYIQKGISDLLSACFILKQRGIDVPLEIVGDGNYYDKIAGLVSRFGLSKVRLIKSLKHDEVIEHVNNSCAVILVSRYEGQSMFATEAIASAKPVIFTNDNGMSDLIKDGINGYVVKTGDCLDIAEKIELILKQSREKLLSMGLNSKDIYDKHYSPEAVSNIFSSIIEFSIK